MVYRAYLRTFDGNVPTVTKTITPDAAAALDAFAALVNKAELDGQKWAAVLSRDNRQVAFHRFDRQPGDADYWRDKLDQIEIGPRPAHRPVSIDARRVNVSLDDDTIERAKAIGGGNLSAGIREAVRLAYSSTSTPSGDAH